MNSLQQLLITFIMLSYSTSVWAALLEVDSSVLGDTAHFEFRGKDTWNYDVKKRSDGKKAWVEVRVPQLNDAAVARLKSFRGGPVKGITIDPQGADQTNVLQIILETADVESFDYLTDQPSRLILDLYPQKPKDFAKDKQKKAETEGLAKKTIHEKNQDKPERADRKIATTDVLIVKNETLEQLKKDIKSGEEQSGIFDGGDPQFNRFSIQDYEIKEDSIIQSRDKDYIEFPILHLKPEELEILNSRRPTYEIQPTESQDAKKVEENKMARLLVTLFQRKRYLVFLKTTEWFFEKFPKSEYDEVVRFMMADTHYALWEENTKEISHFEMAMFRYREAIEKYPQSQLAERTLLLTGFASLDRGDYLGTLRTFQQALSKRPSSANKDLARLAIAEAYLKLNLFQDAIDLYSAIEKDGKNSEDRVRAAFLKGDVYFQKKDDAGAIEAYQKALGQYAGSKKDYPNALYNQAAAFFRAKEYKKSLELYREFLQAFPAHHYAGFAMTRVGELLDILGADQSRVNGAYLEAYFRYGTEPSSVVARMRLLIGRMPQMKPKEVEKATADVRALAEKSDLPRIREFATLSIAEGSARRGNFDEAVDMLVKYYQQNPTTADTKKLDSRIVRYINDKMTEQVKAGKSIEALATHNQYATTWLKNSDRIDTKFWVGKAFENSGVPKQAEKLYKDTLNKIYSLKGTKAGVERAVLEKVPSTDELNLRLAATEYAQGDWSHAYDQLKKIEKPEHLSEKDQVERVQMISSLLEKRGESEIALRYLADLIKTWRGVSSLVAAPYYDAGQIEEKLGRREDAIRSYQRVDELMADSGQVSGLVHSKSLERLAQLHLDSKQDQKAAPVLEKLLNGYEKSRPLASYRYQLGKIYFSRGDLNKANETWDALKAEKSTFWYQMAQEQLRGAGWDDEYKKYIKRIPAMERKEN